MQIEGKFILKAPIKDVWGFLLNPGTLASCVPGTEKMEAIDDKTYYSEVKQKVGPIGVTVKFTTVLSEITPPTHCKAIGKGSDVTKTSTFTQETTVDLKELSKGEVEVAYVSNVHMVGRLATFGERIMRAKVKSVGEEFTRNLQEKLKSQTASK